MNLLLLPGNSSKNKEWIDAISEGLKPGFEKVQVHYYQHWKQGGGMKFAYERDEIGKTIQNEKELMVFAKSAGVAMIMEVQKHFNLDLRRAVFCGTTQKSAAMLQSWSIPTMFIQESEDPFLHFNDLLELVGEQKVENFFVSEISGNKHRYEPVDTIVEISKYFYHQHL